MAQTTLKGSLDTPAAGTRMRSLDELPGPPAWPLLGNLLDIEPDRIHLQLEEWATRYGPLAVYRLGRRRVLLVSDLALAQTVFRQRPDAFRRQSSMARVVEEIIGANVFSAEGAEWKNLRRLSMEALSARYVRRLYPAIASLCDRLRARWIGFACAGQPVDVQTELIHFAVDVTTCLTLGVDLNTLEGKDDGLQQHLARLFPAILRRITAPLPYWRWIKLPADRELARSVIAIQGRLVAIIQETRAAAGTQLASREPRSFIEAMLAARDPEGRPYTTEQVVSNLLTMLLGGEDTTANMMAWAMHHLCDAPDAFAALRCEADAVLGDGLVLASEEHADQLEVAEAVASESLRLRPVVAWHSYEALVDTELGGVLVPRGTPVQIVARPTIAAAEGRSGPARFDPLGRLDRRRAGGPAPADFPFGSGPRICPGRHLALLEARVVLSMLARNFDIERVGDGSAVRELARFTMVPHGIRIRLAPRSSAMPFGQRV